MAHDVSVLPGRVSGDVIDKTDVQSRFFAQARTKACNEAKLRAQALQVLADVGGKHVAQRGFRRGHTSPTQRNVA